MFEGKFVMCSVNVVVLLGDLLEVGQFLEEVYFNVVVCVVIQVVLEDCYGYVDLCMIMLVFGVFDLVMYKFEGVFIVEFEQCFDDVLLLELFVLVVYQVIQCIQCQFGVEDLLMMVVDEIVCIIGFDCVMVYCFLYDDSGEVIVEYKCEDFEFFFGQCYLVSDILVQVCCLYVINLICLIVDVIVFIVVLELDYNLFIGCLLDFSYSMLCSVLLVYIEYFSNMGVGVFMSLLIVIGEWLWGLIVCYYMSVYLVLYVVCMLCQLFL